MVDVIAPDSPLVIFFYVVAALSILGSGLVCVLIAKQGSFQYISCRLVFYLHVSLLFEEITTLPYVYNGDAGLCKAFGFIHAYFGLSNVIVTWLVTTYFANYIHCSIPRISVFVRRWNFFLTFVLPLITALPFVDNNFGEDHGMWCSMQADSSNSRKWVFGVYYFWVWLLLLFSLGEFLYLMYDACRLRNTEVMQKVIVTIGMYVMVNVICWIPRTTRRVYDYSQRDFLLLTMPLYIVGLVYTVLFFYDSSPLHLPDAHEGAHDDGVEFDWADSLRITSVDNPLGRVSVSSDQQSSVELKQNV